MSRCIYDVFNCNMEETTGESMPKGKRKFVPNLFFLFFFREQIFLFSGWKNKKKGRRREKGGGGRKRAGTSGCRSLFFFLLNIFFYPLIYRKRRRRRIAERYVGLGIPPYSQLKPRSLNTFKVVLAYRTQCLIISFFLSKSNLKSLNLTLKKNFHLICDTHALLHYTFNRKMRKKKKKKGKPLWTRASHTPASQHKNQ